MSRSLKEIAKEHGCTVRTLQRYIKSGCDIQDPESVKEFAAKGVKFTPRKRIISGMAAPQGDPGDVDELLNVPLPSTEQGAAAGLRRLQEAEPMMHARFLAAEKTGRTGVIQPAQDHWLKILEGLRKYEEAVEMSKRDSQERMPRADALEALRSAAEWMHKGLMLWLSSETPNLMALKDPHTFTVMAKAGIDVAMNDAFEKSQKSKSPVPEWALETLGEAWSCSPI